MYKFIQKNQKKFLAVFAVGLMVVFVLPTTVTNYQGRQDVAFRVAGEDVSTADARQAAEDWDTLQRTLGGNIFMLFPSSPELLGAMQQDRDLFLLLQKEATLSGLRVPDDDLKDVTEAIMRGAPPRDGASIRRALHGVMLVRALVEHVAGGIKASGPLVLREMAQNGQRVKLDLVHYAGEDFAKDAAAAAPAPEQLQKQFDEHKNTPPGNPNEQNPFGFGYLVPAQVKLLYLTVPRDEVIRAVRKRKSEFDWDVDAITHYKQNLAKFPVTQPATTQATNPATGPTTGPAAAPTTRTAATAPTTRPFADVREDIVGELLKPEVDRELDRVAAALTARMTADHEARQRRSAGAPEDFGTRQYLERVAKDVEAKSGVRLGISEINEPKSEQGLRELKGIGQSFSGSTSFPQFVTQWAEPLAPASQKNAASVLSLDEPSPAFRDLGDNVYVFQIREATPAAPPADLNAVRAKVEADVRTKLAFAAAVTQAKTLREAAAGGKRLEAAAKDAGKDVFTTPDFLNPRGMNSAGEPVTLIPRIELPEASRQALVTRAFELLGDATPDKPHPTAVVELPAAGRVAVIEVADVERLWKDDQQELVQYQAAQQITRQRAQRVLAEYFTLDAVKRRLNYANPNERPTQTASAT